MEKSINNLIALGESIVFKNYNISDFENYKSLLIEILKEKVIAFQGDNIKIRTCQLILSSKPSDHRYNFLQIVFSPYHRTGKIGFPRNTEEEINKRYILDINCKLPILE